MIRGRKRRIGVIAAILLFAIAAAPRRTALTRDESVAEGWLRGMTLRDKVAQLMIIACVGEDPGAQLPDYQRFAHYVRDLHVGGFIVNNRVISGSVRNAEPHAMGSFLNRMQRLSRIPLITAGDFERGASMRVADTARFPHLMAYGAANDLALTRALGAATAREAVALGIHWVFAPDADVNNNPDNPIINTRSFGEDPKLVSQHVRSFIEGARSVPQAKVLVTVKHFPGHGDTDVDSHMNLPVLNAPAERIRSLELEPFRAAIVSRVDAVMSAHMAVPAIDESGVPATVSRKLLTGVLRDELGFRGMIVTDAMDMQGLTKQFSPGEAAVRALEAGADILLMPREPEQALEGVVEAVRSGRLTEKRISDSSRRMLQAKARVGLQAKKLVDIESITTTIEDPELTAEAQRAADRAITLLRNDGAVLPLHTPEQSCFWILSESRYGQGGRRFLDEVRHRSRTAKAWRLDPLTVQPEVDAMLAKATNCSVHVIAALASTGAYNSAASLPGTYPKLLESLQQQNKTTVFVAVGTPYVARVFPAAPALVFTFSSAPTSEAAAVKELFGEIQPGGRMPVSIPGIAHIGDGM